jgi:hypothetical protein
MAGHAVAVRVLGGRRSLPGNIDSHDVVDPAALQKRGAAQISGAGAAGTRPPPGGTRPMLRKTRLSGNEDVDIRPPPSIQFICMLMEGPANASAGSGHVGPSNDPNRSNGRRGVYWSIQE